MQITIPRQGIYSYQTCQGTCRKNPIQKLLKVSEDNS